MEWIKWKERHGISATRRNRDLSTKFTALRLEKWLTKAQIDEYAFEFNRQILSIIGATANGVIYWINSFNAFRQLKCRVIQCVFRWYLCWIVLPLFLCLYKRLQQTTKVTRIERCQRAVVVVALAVVIIVCSFMSIFTVPPYAPLRSASFTVRVPSSALSQFVCMRFGFILPQTIFLISFLLRVCFHPLFLPLIRNENSFALFPSHLDAVH